ncbi:nuclease harbi1 [Lasius niger]|uniref:Nuclease harbi1 n=1 Tax=Lasius niger TaxID=67767 RepID=A0A0J7KDQ9_LASNI|nr:nuclease harbi1 [Lasius niger]
MEERRRNVILAIATVSGHNLLRTAVENLQYEQSSDEDCDRWNQEANALTTRVRGRRNLRHHVTRIEGYVTITISNYTDRQFREHFHVTRRTYENLEQILTPELIRRADTGRTTLDVRTQLLSVLWLLATPDSFRSVSDRFGISKSMLHDSMRRVVASLNSLADRFIKWPVACCVLHNICLEGCDDDIRDFIDEGLEQDPDNNDNADNEEGREVIPDQLPNDQRGVARREYLTALLAQNLP